MQKSRYRNYLQAAFLCCVFVLTLFSVFHGENLSQVWYYLQSADIGFVCAGVVCVILFILGESVILLLLLRALGTRAQFGHCCLYSFIGFFYSCITPSASGGQPMQAVAMKKDRIPIAVSTVVLAIVTITYKLVLVVIGLAVVVIRPFGLMDYFQTTEPLILLGIVLNVGCIALLLMMVFHPALMRKCAEKTLALINRIRPFKHPEKMSRRLERTMEQYTGTADYYRSHKALMAFVFLITFMQRMLLFGVTWFTYRAFGLQGTDVVTILLLQAMISVAADMLPLPGGMGVSENLFLEIFLPVFGAQLILPGMVISRGVSYYTQLAISAVMTLAASFIIRDNTQKEMTGNATDRRL